ncbi:menaquinone biosynthetic enzyme MqnA/MqnD family protein [Acidicapsa dinghuensis]|uniref:Chorismate dehydratase n=1 Tax=Acidicapsa dinghuensis TaxID=2218256 RepID=A0ABW1EIU0_9BACT|nr:menaquinone biosynthesis protein [Acidicapsa dinghuensis]
MISSTPASPTSPLRIAAINFLNPAPLMWDFNHEPHKSQLAQRYQLELMLPSACADRLALPIYTPGAADIGLIPIAALATTPGLRVIPGCTIASRRKVRSILLVRRANQLFSQIRTVAADTSSRSSLAYTRILFRKWWNPGVIFLPSPPDLDRMLEKADAAILIGDPALYALEERQNREERTGESLIYHDVAEEWITHTGSTWVAAVWAIREESIARSGRTIEDIASDFTASRDRGLANIETLVKEWSARLPLPAATIRTYLTENIYYYLDENCQKGIQRFFDLAVETGVLPSYEPK